MTLVSFLSNINTNQIKALKTETIAKFDDAAIGALNVNASALSAEQVKSIKDDSIDALDFTKLSAKSVSGLTAAHIDALTTGIENADKITATVIANLSAEAVNSLDEAQLKALGDSEALKSLTPKQVQFIATAVLTKDVLNVLDATQIGSLSTTQIKTLTGTVLKEVTAENLSKMTAAQVNALNDGVVKDLTNDQLAKLAVAALKGLEKQDFDSLKDAQLDALFLLDGSDAAASQSRIAQVNADWVTAAYLDQTSETP